MEWQGDNLWISSDDTRHKIFSRMAFVAVIAFALDARAVVLTLDVNIADGEYSGGSTRDFQWINDHDGSRHLLFDTARTKTMFYKSNTGDTSVYAHIDVPLPQKNLIWSGA